MRLYCYNCGKSVSSEVPDGTVVRAALQCPECLQAAIDSFNVWELEQEAKENLSPVSPEAYWAKKGWSAAIEKMCRMAGS